MVQNSRRLASILLFVAGLSIALHASSAGGDSPPATARTTATGISELPAAVLQEAEEMRTECRTSGGTPLSSNTEFIERADLTGDGRPDFVIDQAKFRCEGAWSLFGGSGGTGLLVYASTSEHIAVPAWYGFVFGHELVREKAGTALYLNVAGGYCGQQDFKSNADAIACQRPLQWNPASKAMEIAPLSRIRPLAKQGPSVR